MHAETIETRTRGRYIAVNAVVDPGVDQDRLENAFESPMMKFASEAFIRALDIVISVTVMLFLLPVLVVVGLFVVLQDGGPVFYGQLRIGKDGREFRCYKFRSMLVDADARLRHLLQSDAQARAEWDRDHKLKRDPRITAFGRFIRKTSLDEFPQLWNVLRGEMSLVGPRPIVQAEMRRYGKSIRNYLSVRPGITGLWQVAGRNDVTYFRRVAMDRLFSRKKTVANYVMILVMTVPAVLFQRGSY